MYKSANANWPELKLPHGVKADTLIAPHILVRSAVFSTLEYAGAAKRPTITAAETLPLQATSQYRVEQVDGPRLSQSDAELLYWLLARFYREGVLTGRALTYFKCGEALSALGRSRGGKSDALLGESLSRLTNAEFRFKVRVTGTDVSLGLVRTKLLSSFERVTLDSFSYDYRVMIADGVAALLEDGSWLALSAQVRQKFNSDPLAKGLHAYFASNKQIFAMWPETLKGLMGRDTMQDSKWIQALERSLLRVRAATAWPECELAKAGQSAGKVVVRKSSQRQPATESGEH